MPLGPSTPSFLFLSAAQALYSGNSVVQKRRESEALRDVANRADKAPSVWERAVQDRQRLIRETYLARAEQLERGEADDRRLAKDIRAFVAGMAVPLTRRQAMTAELGGARAEHLSAPAIATATEHPAPSSERDRAVREWHRSEPRR
jgi:hypothetical protein